ncbi:MAG: antibiotic biosynthesis monooxygenase [Burkholderiales bacterium]|nr:antibiotic biosynthesis monooxygenase [Burkholderiales bacterium]
MTAFNAVRFRVKPGAEGKFLEEHGKMAVAEFTGFRRGALVKTGERTYCMIAEWDDMASLAASRPKMIANLDRIRDTLEDLGGGLGVTDPVSGEAVMSFGR